MDDDLVLNLATDDAQVDRPNSRRVAQASKSTRWTDRVKAKRVAKRKDDSIQKSQPSQSEENAPQNVPNPRPAKRQKLDSASASVPASKPSAASRPYSAPRQPQTTSGQVISSLFTSNPAVPVPAPIAPSLRAGPSNAPLDASSFAALGLDPLLTAHLKTKLSISAPTSIQRAALSSILSTADDDSRDIFIQSQTGSGKTLAYLLPIIQDLLPLSKLSFIDRSIGTLAIIVAPTRELAKQISDVLELLLTLRLRSETENANEDENSSARMTRWLVSGVLTGGATRTHEKARLRKGLPILVATPGRLLDHLQNTSSFNVGKCRWLIMDEADRLMELGFEETMGGILKGLEGRRKLAKLAASEGIVAGDNVGGWDWERRRRTVLCSATIQEGVQRLAGEALQNPIIVKGSDVPATSSDAIPDPNALKKPEGASAAVVAPTPTKFTPPAQLAQKYVVVPLKLRLVSLVALLRGIIAQAPTYRPGRVGGTRIIVFLSCTDSVDFHWDLLGGVQMGAEARKDPVDDGSDSDSDSASEADESSPRKKKNGKDTPPTSSGKERVTKNSPLVAHQSPLLPGTKIYRLHGSLPLATRTASLKGFTSDPSPKSSSSTKTQSQSPPEPTSAILLCTSVASRGLDLPLVRAVVQYDLPTENGAAEYVHRVGRTARAGKGGEAWSFVAPSESMWVDWIQENMGSAVPAEVTSTTPNAPNAGNVKLDAVGVEEVLRRGFGGGVDEYEDRATQVQLSFEQWVLRSSSHADEARKAFQSHIRAYSTHPSSEKHIFHIRNLHTGHLAKAFALRETPKGMSSTSAASSLASAKKGKSARDSGRPKGSKKLANLIRSPKSIAEAVARSNGNEKPKYAQRRPNGVSLDTRSTEDRMRDAVRAQGRLTKAGGALVSSGTGEFQLPSMDALEKLAGSR